MRAIFLRARRSAWARNGMPPQAFSGGRSASAWRCPPLGTVLRAALPAEDEWRQGRCPGAGRRITAREPCGRSVRGHGEGRLDPQRLGRARHSDLHPVAAVPQGGSSGRTGADSGSAACSAASRAGAALQTDAIGARLCLLRSRWHPFFWMWPLARAEGLRGRAWPLARLAGRHRIAAASAPVVVLPRRGAMTCSCLFPVSGGGGPCGPEHDCRQTGAWRRLLSGHAGPVRAAGRAGDRAVRRVLPDGLVIREADWLPHSRGAMPRRAERASAAVCGALGGQAPLPAARARANSGGRAPPTFRPGGPDPARRAAGPRHPDRRGRGPPGRRGGFPPCQELRRAVLHAVLPGCQQEPQAPVVLDGGLREPGQGGRLPQALSPLAPPQAAAAWDRSAGMPQQVRCRRRCRAKNGRGAGRRLPCRRGEGG